MGTGVWLSSLPNEPLSSRGALVWDVFFDHHDVTSLFHHLPSLFFHYLSLITGKLSLLIKEQGNAP